MIHRNICPICGNENPEGTEICQVCKANLANLPDDMFPRDPEPLESKAVNPAEITQNENEELDLDHPILPEWLKGRFNSNEKKSMDMNSYLDAMFGVPPTRTNSSAGKPAGRSPLKPKSQPVFQPELDLVEKPLVETNDDPRENQGKYIESSDPFLVDFRAQRPAKKWEDLELDEIIESVREQNEKAFPPVEEALRWWREDLALTEDDDDDSGTSKSAYDDDPVLTASASPTKLVDAEELFAQSTATATAVAEAEPPVVEIPAPVVESYQPETGSLLSALMDEIDQNVAEANNTANEDTGTVFYTDNNTANQSPVVNETVVEVDTADNAGLNNVNVLDQILRNIGFHVEGEVKPEVNEETGSGAEPPAANTEKPRTFAVVQESEAEEPVNDDPLAMEPHVVREKENDYEEPDIPWDLFGNAEMTLPRAPEGEDYRTFSRNGIPEDPGATTYQQRMLSSILGKIIQAENYVPSKPKSDYRKINLPARLFWSVLAIVGVVLILLSGITDRFTLPAIPASEESVAFYSAAEEISGDALLVMDYTPAYSAEMDNAVDGLLEVLESSADRIYLSAMNPSALTGAQRILNNHPDTIEFAGWWPAGPVSIRSRLAQGDIPGNIWLLTSESGSVRDWTEQITASNGGYQLHVVASGQLEPLLDVYKDAGMTTAFLSRDYDLNAYAEESHTAEKTQFAVWYLVGLLPLAWLGGLLAKFLRREPDYGRKSTTGSVPAAEPISDKETEDDGQL